MHIASVDFARLNPPYFHVLCRDGAAQISIATLEILAISGKVDLREALVWAAANRALLEAKWNEFSGDAA
jgi:hypothetical protein